MKKEGKRTLSTGGAVLESGSSSCNWREILFSPGSFFIKNKILAYILPPAILSVITAIVYYPSLNYPFQFDDIANITKRFSIRFDNPLSRWWYHSRWFSDWLNRINFEISRFNPFYYRVFNLVIHIVAGLCLFFLVRELCNFLKKDSFFRHYSTFIAFLCSGLFLLHPVQTQTVSYVIQARLEGLAGCFVIATLLMYVNTVKAKNILIRALFGTFFVAFGMMACGTKEVVIVLPFLILLADWFFISQQTWSKFRKRFFLHAVFLTLFIVLFVHYLGTRFIKQVFSLKTCTGNNRGNIITSGPFDVITPWNFFYSEFKVVLHYLYIFVWPFNISVEYDWRLAPSFFSFQVIAPLMILLSMLGTAIYGAVKKRYFAFSFGFLWFLLSIAPRSSIVPSPELVCDYKTYLASVGIYFILSSAIVYVLLWAYAQVRQLPKIFLFHEGVLACITVLIIFLGLSSYQRNLIWRTSVDFWEDNVKKSPGKARTLNNYGVALSEVRRFDDAISAYSKAIAMDSYYADPWSNLSVAYSLKGEIDKAIESLRGAIHICPNYPEAYNNMGTLLLQKKLYDDAERSLKTAISLRPYYGKAYYNMARLYEETGKKEEAWDFLKKASEGDLDTPEVFFKLGQLGLRVKKYKEALTAFEQVIKRGVSNNQVLFNLANACFMLKDYKRAKSLYTTLMQNSPLDARYAYNLAETFFTENDFESAYGLYRKILTLPKPTPQAFFRLAHCMEKMEKIDEAVSYLKELLTLKAGDDFEKAVKEEIMRIALNNKVKEGDGSIYLKELKKVLAMKDTLGSDKSKVSVKKSAAKSKKA